MRKAGASVLFVLFMALLQGCYSFRGTAVPAHCKTIAIPVFEDRSGAGVAAFRAELTKALVNRVESQSALLVIPSVARADLLLEGVIISFSDAPGQLSSMTERAVKNRITLVVQVTVAERAKKVPVFTHSFVGFAEYPVGNYAAQQEAIRFSLNQIIDDIFDRLISG